MKKRSSMILIVDFFAFWDLCLFLNHSNPREAFLETAGLRLVGPFDLMPESQVKTLTSSVSSYEILLIHKSLIYKSIYLFLIFIPPKFNKLCCLFTGMLSAYKF
jgi:hypothetical protein